MLTGPLDSVFRGGRRTEGADSVCVDMFEIGKGIGGSGYRAEGGGGRGTREGCGEDERAKA